MPVPNNAAAIRNQYEQYGVAGYYQQYGSSYRNPHEPHISAALQAAVAQLQPDTTAVLDLACGSGEITLALRACGCEGITGLDPYTGEAYQQRTGQTALPYKFEQIAAGVLSQHRYSLIVCSFALHLVSQSRLPVVCYQLARIAPHLLILTPHKRPHIKAAWGWQMTNETSNEHVRTRYYESTL